MAAVLDTAPNAASDFMSVRGVCEYAGVAKNTVFTNISKGRLHPLRVAGSTRFLLFRSEILAWRHRYIWRPTPEELAALLAQGYKAEDFTPATPGELAASASPTGGAGEASGAFVSQADVRAYMETLMREGQALAASAASVASGAAQGAVRPFVDSGMLAPMDAATLAASAASNASEGAMRPVIEMIRANVTPLTESLAQAALPRPAPPTEDTIARQMGALRVELAQLLTRMMDAIRPMVERLAAGGYVTPEDVAPFMALVGELAAGLAGSPFYDLSPRDAPAQMPALLAQLSADTLAASHSPTPAPEAGKE